MEKKFNAYDRVLIKDSDGIWQIDFYSYKDSDDLHHVMTYGESNSFPDKDILPYEGNEELVGTTNEPDVEISINFGTELMALTKNKNWIYATLVSTHCRDNYFTVALSNGEDIRVVEICRFSDFDPNDMEETKKHILCVKNGKIVKYSNDKV